MLSLAGRLSRAVYTQTVDNLSRRFDERKRAHAAKAVPQQEAARLAHEAEFQQLEMKFVADLQHAITSASLVSSSPNREVGARVTDGFFASESSPRVLIASLNEARSLTLLSCSWLICDGFRQVWEASLVHVPGLQINFSLPGLPVVNAGLYKNCRAFFDALLERNLILPMSRSDLRCIAGQSSHAPACADRLSSKRCLAHRFQKKTSFACCSGAT